MPTNNPTLIILDGNSILYRAFYATYIPDMPVLQTSFGVPTNAIMNLANMLIGIITTYNPDYMAVAYDAGKHTFRHDLFPDYKGGRKPTPPELVEQFPISRELLDAFGIRHYEADNIEADDIVASLADDAFSQGMHVDVFTSDKDLLQLVSPTVTVHLIKKGLKDIQDNTPDTMLEYHGFRADQVCDYKAINGDASDNLPGIKGIGPKSAQKLLAQYGDLEGIYAHLDELGKSQREKFIENKDSVLLQKQITTVKRDVEFPFALSDCIIAINDQKLIEFFTKYEMRKLAEKVQNQFADSSLSASMVKTTVKWTKVERISASLLKDNVALSLDADCGLYGQNEIYGFALSDGSTTEYIDYSDAIQDGSFIQWLKADNHKLFYDAKHVILTLATHGLTIDGIGEDVMILASLADSTCTSFVKTSERFDLINGKTRESIYGKFDKPKLHDRLAAMEYTVNETQDILTLYQTCYPMVETIECLPLYREVEMPLLLVLCSMEQQGIVCKADILAKIANDLNMQINDLTEKIYETVDHPFNLNSPKQLATVLFDELGLPTGKKRSTSAEVLEGLVGVHPIIDYLLRYRKIGKLYSTYATGLDKYIGVDGRIHTTFNQAATQTGRLSSSDPNLQNISVRDEEGRLIRKAFLPSEGCVLLSCDYSQIELRVLADRANETRLIDAFKEGMDIHTKTAMDVFGLTKDQVDSEHRRKAKAVNFGIVYGISDFGLANQLNITPMEARSFIQTYLTTYPGIKDYMDQIVKFCQENGYVTTITNRRREIPEIHDKSYTMREFGKRAAMNAPIQGSAADLIKIAMLEVERAMRKANVKSKMILQVHDELIFDVPKDEVELMCKLVEETMENALIMKVPLKAEVKVGNDWYEAK